MNLHTPVLANQTMTLNQNWIQLNQQIAFEYIKAGQGDRFAVHKVYLAKNMARLFLPVVALMAVALSSLAVAEDPVPTEIGTVNWQRDYESAKKTASESGKPLLMFFQEVPG